jgi:hypothetical protein
MAGSGDWERAGDWRRLSLRRGFDEFGFEEVWPIVVLCVAVREHPNPVSWALSIPCLLLFATGGHPLRPSYSLLISSAPQQISIIPSPIHLSAQFQEKIGFATQLHPEPQPL